jgi:hypothetical protein
MQEEESAAGKHGRIERSSAGHEGAVAGVLPVPSGLVEPQSLRLDESSLVSHYTNFVRVTGTAEEVILDVGLNKQAPAGQPEAVAVTERIVLSFYTAKRLLNALRMSVQRHEANFGHLETNVRQRLVKKSS